LVRIRSKADIGYPETKAGGDRKSKKSSGHLGHMKKDRFTKDTAKLAGQSERKVRRNATRGKKVVVLAGSDAESLPSASIQ
jgi:hypothetical protein